MAHGETYLLGRNAKAYYNTAAKHIGETGVETVVLWLEDAATTIAGNLTDVSLEMDSDYADATTRSTAASGFSSQVAVLKNGQVTFEMRWIPDDPGDASTSFANLLVTAWETDDTIAMAFLDQLGKTGEIPTGTTLHPQGLASNWSVSMSKTEALRDVQRASITLTVADSATWFSEDVVGAL